MISADAPAVGRSATPSPDPSRRDLLRAVLVGAAATVVATCSQDTTGTVPRFLLAAGPEGGSSNAFSRALEGAVAANGRHLEIILVPTLGSIDSLRQLDTGAAFALARADAAENAVLGHELFSRPIPGKALARIYENYTHLVVPADGPVRSVEDLAGRRVRVGPEGAGDQGRRLLHAAGLTGARSVQEQWLGLAESVDTLRLGKIDALIWSGAVPTPALSALAQDLPLRFLALDGLVRPLRDIYGPVYTAVTLPAGVYGLREPVSTLGVGYYLMARTDTSERAVRSLLEVVFDRWSDLIRDVTAGARLEPRFAISTGKVPLHPGARAYYRSAHE